MNARFYACVFFDFDGVIICNSQLIGLQILAEKLMNYDVEYSYTSLVENYLGWRGEVIIVDISQKLGVNISPLVIKETRSDFKERIFDEGEIDKDFEKYASTIENRYICSSNTRKFINEMLAFKRLSRYFPADNIFTLENVQIAKPNPEVYIKAIESSGMHCNDCIAIEDSDVGALAAKQAGLYTVGYTGSGNDVMRIAQYNQLSKAGVDKVIEGFGELCNPCDLK